MNKWEKPASDMVIKKTISALWKNGIAAEAVDTQEEAKKKVLELIPKGVEVMNMSSVTLDTVSIAEAINSSGKYLSVKNKLNKMDRSTQGLQMQKLGAAPQYALGSVHAVTEDGKVLIASNSGSQLPAYAYGASRVIWVVGTQKIVKNLDEGINRIYEESLKLESERVKIVYGWPGSFVSKILIVNKEIAQNRINLIFIKEKIGF